MTAYTSNFNLYKPDIEDSGIEVAPSLKTNFETIDTELKNRKDELESHQAAVNAHESSKIKHGDGSVQDTLFELGGRIDEAEGGIEHVENRISTIVAQAGTDNTEIVDARGGFAVLHDRLEKESVYFRNIEVEKFHDDVSNTNYILTTIPYQDEDGNVIEIKRGFAGDAPGGKMAETVRNFANRHNATVTVNASVFDMTTNDLWGTQVNNGVVLSDGTISGRYVLGIKPDNTFVTYPPGTTGQTVINDGCVHALTSFIPLIQDGSSVDQSILDGYASGSGKFVRQVLAQYANKDILILTNDTGAGDNLGMTSDDCIRLLLAKGVQFAYMLDGGGSAQTVLRGTLLNRARDNEGYTERVVPDFLYFNKPIPSNRDKDIVLTNEDLGELSKRVADIIIDLTNKTDMNKGYIALKGASDYVSQGIESWQGSTKNTKLALASNELNYYDYVNSKYLLRAYSDGRLQTSTGVVGNFFDNAQTATDLNTITRSGFYWATTTVANIPDTSASWSIIHIHVNATSAMQIAHSYASPFQKKVRRLSSGTWGAWV